MFGFLLNNGWYRKVRGMVNTKTFIGENLRHANTPDGLIGYIAVDDVREILEELEKCYVEIKNKGASISKAYNDGFARGAKEVTDNFISMISK
jgi:hypothetical protein